MSAAVVTQPCVRNNDPQGDLDTLSILNTVVSGALRFVEVHTSTILNALYIVKTNVFRNARGASRFVEVHSLDEPRYVSCNETIDSKRLGGL